MIGFDMIIPSGVFGMHCVIASPLAKCFDIFRIFRRAAAR